MRLKDILTDFRRTIVHSYQKLTRGFSDRDLWNLDYALARWLLPRIKEFRKHSEGVPGDLCWDDNSNDIPFPDAKAKWNLILDDIEYALGAMVKEWDTVCYKDIDWDRVKKGCELLGKHLRGLWW